MVIQTQLNSDGSQVTLKVVGRFDANSLDEFRSAYEGVDATRIEKYEVDLSEAEYLDSSALGMLLVLRDFSGGDSDKIHITHCSPEVKKIFLISSFDRLFKID